MAKSITARHVAELEAENAKLRELCETMYGRLQAADDATGMGWIDARLTNNLRKLGIEVDA